MFLPGFSTADVVAGLDECLYGRFATANSHHIASPCSWVVFSRRSREDVWKTPGGVGYRGRLNVLGFIEHIEQSERKEC